MKTFSERLLVLVTVLYLAVIAGFVLLWHTGRLDEDPTATVKPDNRYSQTLTVVGDMDYKPFSFLNDKGKADGHDIELAAELANRMNMNLDIKLMNWEDALDAMKKGEADLIMGIELQVDDKAHDFIEATVPISKDSISVFAPRAYRDIMALNSLKMAEIVDSGREGLLEASGIVVTHDAYPDYTSALKAVSKGDDDFVMMRYATGMQTLKKSGITNLRPSVKLMDNYLCFGGNPRNPSLLDAVNVELERMSSDGVMDRLSEKWMESFVSAQPIYVVFRHYPLLYGIVAAMLVIYILVLNMVSAEKNRQKILARSLRRDSVYQRALFSGAFAFVEF
ncbi:MAG: transporter substrate-binding domain-containing protein, partial [Abditibacteriota bacterium]|nr:transporter substrate-binding domain-containing protein [Abditibacteriota bacterium]